MVMSEFGEGPVSRATKGQQAHDKALTENSEAGNKIICLQYEQ